MSRNVERDAKSRTARIGIGLAMAVAVAGCGGGGASMSASAGPSGSGAAPNVVQATPVQHVTVGDLSVGYRVIGPPGAASARDAASGPGDSTGSGSSQRGGSGPSSAAPGSLVPGATWDASASSSPASDGQPPLLMIMGSSGTMDEWSPALVSALAQDRQVVVFDNRGMGETNDPSGAYPFGQLADDTAGLITALGHDRMDVLGWSMGGDVAIDLAVRHPDLVGRMISYAGDAGGSTAVMPSPDVIATLTDTSGTPQQRGERLLELLYPAAYRAAHPDFARTFPIPTEQTSGAAIDLQNAAIARWAGVEDGIAGIANPALFVTGSEDVLTPPENASVLADVVPGSWLVRFPGAGHGLMYQDPEGLAKVVLLFLDVATPPAGAGG